MSCFATFIAWNEIPGYILDIYIITFVMTRYSSSYSYNKVSQKLF